MGIADLLSTYGQNYLTALLTTWRMTLISFALVMVLSVVITVMRVCPFKPLRVFGDLYVQIFRNIPGAFTRIKKGAGTINPGGCIHAPAGERHASRPARSFRPTAQSCQLMRRRMG